MKLTRRGYGAVAIVVAAELSALGFGSRSLNAIVAPIVIALIGGALQIRLASSPTASRGPIAPGFPGDTRTMSVDVSGGGVGHVTQEIPPGIKGTEVDRELSLPGSFEMELTLGQRGQYTLPGLEVTVTDLLGLVAKTYTTGGTTDVTVYPAVYQLAGREQFLQDVVDQREVERQEFDSLREYVPGDPLRDVHWKSSAKEPDNIYVKEFIDRRVDANVVIVATGEPETGAAMATAAASMAALALDLGLGVELHVAHLTIPLGRGESHRVEIFDALATISAGPLPREEPDADVRIHATETGVELTVGSRTSSLEELTVSRQNPFASESEGVEVVA